MAQSDICILIAITVYLISVIGIGVIYAKKTSTVSDFYLGGRTLGPFVTAMSAEASDMSSWLLMGLPGVAYMTGVADAAWTAIGLAAGTYINWLIVAKRLRRYTEVAGNSTTLPEFFSKRFRDNRKILSLIAAIVIIIFFVPYTASGFAACGKLFASLFDVNYVTAMIISAIVIVGYTTLGGFLAASTTDFMQSIIMTVALAIILIYGTISAGGVGDVIDNAKSIPGYFSLTSIDKSGASSNYSLLTICSTLAWGLGYFGMPHVLLRFMAIEDENKLKLSRRIASVWVVISLSVAVLIGVIGNAMSAAGSIEDLSDPETLVMKIASLISSHGILPALVAGLILAGILAATMSTADSQLLAASSSMSKDILTDFFGIKLKEKTAMLIARITVVLIAIVGVFLAKDPDSSVFKIVSFAWAGFGAAFGPVVLFGLFWKRTNKWGALAGMVSGGSMVFIWKYVISTHADKYSALGIYELLPAFIIACIAIVVVSLLTPAPSQEIIDEFEKVNSTK